GKIPCILTGPDAKYGLESTVIDCTGKHPVILRPGSITLEQLKKLDKQTKYGRTSRKVKSPGQKYRHYKPKANVRLIADFGSRIANSKNKKAFIGLSKKLAKGFELVKICRTPEEYAKNLFSFFHKCDEMGIKTIYCEKISEKGIGAAIMNRLKKASVK
nr:Sua5 family C-terminal domain-containing protein [Ignavibacteria bacterium]